MKKYFVFLFFFLFLTSLFCSSCSTNPDHKNPFDPETPLPLQSPAKISGKISLEDEPDCSGVSIEIKGEYFNRSVVTGKDENDGTGRCGFAILNIYPGTYRIVFSTRYYQAVVSDNVHLGIGESVDLGEIELKLLRLRVEGKVAFEFNRKEYVNPAGTLITLKRVELLQRFIST